MRKVKSRDENNSPKVIQLKFDTISIQSGSHTQSLRIYAVYYTTPLLMLIYFFLFQVYNYFASPELSETGGGDRPLIFIHFQ